jgi:hypothetical protein
MISRLQAPEGFDLLEAAGATLLARRELVQPLTDLGLGSPEGWRRLLPASHAAAGRGSTARITLPGDERLLLKKLIRGGLAGRFRRELFSSSGRLLDNIRLPLEALRRGIPTAAPAALLLAHGPGGMHRGWLALEEIAGARDLSELYSLGCSPSEAELGAAMAVVRLMHEAGLVHPDLNLGNLLIRERSGEYEAYVIDLDKASFSEGPLPFKRRRAALRRLERSYVKGCHFSGRRPERSERDRFYRLYAAGDSGLVARLAQGRASGAFQIYLHRIWWLLSR